ncbi:MAG TPA: response regulator transcription factor [Cyclobacteriaceae bacterium]|nr:response regulator transcription factor [Cyclobacteriaceae bacterium]
MTVLVIEDEVKFATLIKSGLEQHGHAVDLAYDGFLADNFVTQKDYDVILLDVVIPLINGIDLCSKIKERKPHIPILMLTALGTTSDKARGFDAGADDYLVKPFEFEELLMRIKALTKRRTLASGNSTKGSLRVGDLKLDLYRKIAERSGKKIHLTAKEFELLEFLMRNEGRVLSRPEIAENVWELTFDTGTNIVEVYINLLRRKVDKDFEQKLIHTRVGLGYMMSVEP